MKKLLAILLATLCVASMAVVVNAGATKNEARNIPMAATAPTIDGVITGDEWDKALTLSLNKNTCDAIIGTMDNAPEATLRLMWNDKGLYLFADVKDTTACDPLPRNSGSYNSGDGIQLCLYPDVTKSGTASGDLYFWSLVVAEGDKAEIGEHFVYSDGLAGVDVEDAVVAATKNGSSYTIEGFIPSACWKSSKVPVNFTKGTTFALTNVLMEHNGVEQTLLADSAWFDGANSNKYTLSADVAGHVEATTTTAATTTAATPTETTAANVTTVADATTPAPDTNPPTDDSAATTVDAFIVTSAVLALAACGGIAVSKKKR